MALFICRVCSGKVCRHETPDGPEIVVPSGKCTIIHPPHGARAAIEEVEQVWQEELER
ncbi:hypothetical protein J2129_002733 [Methanofollis sp. W23]|uniref:hypothetical protein n=1 Tax=Methanofollis sp. W23 TaxID=2817849 RepID=UPI001AEA38D2|nr:hypothetical protein [Methanofollis sp. W23]MBP2147220.1 hypothetical protein [Methanofollis sp. W23]